MQRIRIVGGISSCGRVSILSDEFISSARYREGRVTCEVERLSSLLRFLYKHKGLPIPRLVRMALFFADSMAKSWVSIFIAVFFLRAFTVNSTAASSHSIFDELTRFAVVLLAVFAYSIWRVAKWHGAEHMAIAAYENSGNTDVQSIERESTINKKCGGRLILPLLASVVISNLIAKNFGVNVTIAFLAVMEAMLWVDTLKGWDNIPVTSQASDLLQKWVTTRRPETREVLTAQRALSELVRAHGTKV